MTLPDAGSSPRSLSIAIATFNRPDGLARLLDSLGHLKAPADPITWVSTIVVDNSPDGSARDVVQAYEHSSTEVIYVHEPEPGISAARNRGVASCTADLIAFVDDDEVPDPAWLLELTSQLLADPHAVAAMGPAIYVFEVPPPAWVLDSGVFDVIEMTAGQRPDYLATNNLVLRTDLQDRLGLLFDPRFGLTGGEDHHLGLRLQQAGLFVTSTPRALVSEFVEPERLTPLWVKRRLQRKGGSMASTELSLTATPYRTRARHLVLGAARITVGLGLIAGSPLRSSTTSWAGRRYLYMGVGQVRGALGNVVAEYART